MEFKLPELGENIEEAEVLGVLVSSGDEVEKEQPLLEIETDKASVEVPSPASGTIEEVKVAEGDTIRIGDTLAIIREADDADDADNADDADDADDADNADNADEKDKGKSEDAESSGTGDEDEDEDEDEKAGEAEREEDGGKSPEEADDEETSQEDEEVENRAESTPVPGGVPVFAAPSVRTFAREIGIDIGRVPGSGPGGRISIEDVKRFARRILLEKPDQARAGGIQAGPLPDFSQWGEVEIEDMNAVRKKTAEHMALAWSGVPHVTLFEKADIPELEKTRERHRERIEREAEAKLTITAILLKIVAAGLRKHPEIAATADPAKHRVIRKRYCHIGVAVDTPRGLLVPVLRDVDRKGIVELCGELSRLAKQARERKLKRDAMEGGVFTLTNLGRLGTGFFTPIVNHPEGAILGVGRAATEPVFDPDEDRFEPRLRLPLSLSFDHRLVGGADGARFLHWIVRAIEEPLLALWET